MPDYTPLGEYTPVPKLSEQPPPYSTSGNTITAVKVGSIVPLGAAATTRKLALAAAREVLGDYTPEELILAAHYIATGELPAQEDDNDDE